MGCERSRLTEWLGRLHSTASHRAVWTTMCCLPAGAVEESKDFLSHGIATLVEACMTICVQKH